MEAIKLIIFNIWMQSEQYAGGEDDQNTSQTKEILGGQKENKIRGVSVR